MKDLGGAVVDVVSLNDREIVTKVRLQKTVHLLQSYGLLSDVEELSFEYHYYGPYSTKLARTAEDLEAEKKLQIKVRQGYHSEPYTVYQSSSGSPMVLGQESAAKIRRALELMKQESSLVLEVASTIRFLRDSDRGKDAVAEVKRLKPKKASADRVRKAERLLKKLEKALAA